MNPPVIDADLSAMVERLAAVGHLDEDDFVWPSQLIRKTYVNAIQVKFLRFAGKVSFKEWMPSGGSRGKVEINIDESEICKRFGEERVKQFTDDPARERDREVFDAVVENFFTHDPAFMSAWRNFALRFIRSEADLPRFPEIDEARASGDGAFFISLARVLRKPISPFFDVVDRVILENWEVNNHWQILPWGEGELTLPDELRHPLKYWSDNAALEFVRFFSGLKHNLSSDAYIKRRSRWGLHPVRPAKVKVARIKLVKNPRTIADFPTIRHKLRIDC